MGNGMGEKRGLREQCVWGESGVAVLLLFKNIFWTLTLFYGQAHARRNINHTSRIEERTKSVYFAFQHGRRASISLSFSSFIHRVTYSMLPRSTGCPRKGDPSWFHAASIVRSKEPRPCHYKSIKRR